jgi:hypothetical protein
MFWLCYMMPAIRVVGQKTANPTLKRDCKSAEPVNFTLGFSPIFHAPCNMHYRMYNLSHELHMARIQAQDQPEKARL